MVGERLPVSIQDTPTNQPNVKSYFVSHCGFAYLSDMFTLQSRVDLLRLLMLSGRGRCLSLMK